MILGESALQRSVTKMDVVHLLFGQVNLKCYTDIIQTLILKQVQVTCTAKWTVEIVRLIIRYLCYMINYQSIHKQ